MSNEDKPVEDQSPEEQGGQRPLEENVKSRSTWLRFLFMVIMFIIYGITRLIVLAVVLLQFLLVLFTGEKNKQLLVFSQSLATYTYQVIRFLAFNTEERPFPFDADWPTGPPPE